ncbi:MAG: single-stranded DNA-binding protein [Kiritimatiellae bacterium]|nr:single-stranded DNA-binding protein [Kiritimatiellia bacterium]
MSSMNSVFLMGNLVRDPETRKTPAGVMVGDFSVAVSDPYKDKDGQAVNRTCFVDVVVWGRQAETCVAYLHKGSPVLVEGKLQLDQWKTDQGESRSRLRVRALRVQFLGRVMDAGKPASAPAAASVPAEVNEGIPF